MDTGNADLSSMAAFLFARSPDVLHTLCISLFGAVCQVNAVLGSKP